jgi:SAM-dependent methyltransferase
MTIAATATMKSPGAVSRYDDADFFNYFTLRQYGEAVEIRTVHASSRRDAHAQLLVNRGGAEPFYSTITAILRQVVRPDSRCLDIGCGPGRLAGEMGRLSSDRILGIDQSTLMVAMARAIVSAPVGGLVEIDLGPALGVVPTWGIANCQFLVGDAQCLPVGDESVDVAVVANVLHRVAQPMAVMSELSRVLKVGGHLVASNDYDWNVAFTPRTLWFDDIRSILDPERWAVGLDLDYVPYWSPVSPRKTSVAYNHVIVLTKR